MCQSTNICRYVLILFHYTAAIVGLSPRPVQLGSHLTLLFFSKPLENCLEIDALTGQRMHTRLVSS